MEDWAWKKKTWPKFVFDVEATKQLESELLTDAGIFGGIVIHTSNEDKNFLKIKLVGSEAYKTSEIEGEILDRESLQSSIKRKFGLGQDGRRPKQAEDGVAEMMSDLYSNYAKPLSHKQIFAWHTALMKGRKNLKIGAYRTHTEPMQVVSGALHKPKINFEAPPSKCVKAEMDGFIAWFNGSKDLPILIRAALAHLHFILIHPFEDGNGRIARALTLKAVSQGISQPSLISLSHIIQSKKKAYYDALERSNKSLKIDDWIKYFSQVIIAAQKRSQSLLTAVLAKTKILRDYDLNERQKKILNRLFDEEPDGFKGGLSAENYITITKASRATTTRDLQDLLELKILNKTGEGRWTRYFLNK